MLVTQGKDTFEACASLLPSTQDYSLQKELLRYFCNACAEMSANREKVLQIDALFERIVCMIGDRDRTLGLFALSATQNILPKNPAAQRKVTSSGILHDLLWLLDVPARNPQIEIDAVSDLMWSLVGQVAADRYSFDAFKRLLEDLTLYSTHDTQSLLLSVVSKLLQREDWQAVVACESDGDENCGSAFNLILQLLAKLHKNSDLFLSLGGSKDVLSVQAGFIEDLNDEEAAIALEKIRNKLTYHVADIMTRSDFHNTFKPHGHTIRALIASLDVTKDDHIQMALLVMLGDYANSESVCTALMDTTSIFERVINIIREPSTSKGALLAAFGVLRHLLTPRAQRSRGDSEYLVQSVLGRGLVEPSSNPQLREGCLRLTYLLIEGSERSIDQIVESGPSAGGNPYYVSILEEFSHPETAYKNKTLAARCCVRLLIRLKTLGDLNGRIDLSRFADPLESLLIGGVKALTVEAWYAFALLSKSTSRTSEEMITRILRKASVYRNLIESVLSPEEALRSNAMMVAYNLSTEPNLQKQWHFFFDELVSRPQTIEYHMSQAEAIQLSLIDE